MNKKLLKAACTVELSLKEALSIQGGMVSHNTETICIAGLLCIALIGIEAKWKPIGGRFGYHGQATPMRKLFPKPPSSIPTVRHGTYVQRNVTFNYYKVGDRQLTHMTRRKSIYRIDHSFQACAELAYNIRHARAGYYASFKKLENGEIEISDAQYQGRYKKGQIALPLGKEHASAQAKVAALRDNPILLTQSFLHVEEAIKRINELKATGQKITLHNIAKAQFRYIDKAHAAGALFHHMDRHLENPIDRYYAPGYYKKVILDDTGKKAKLSGEPYLQLLPYEDNALKNGKNEKPISIYYGTQLRNSEMDRVSLGISKERIAQKYKQAQKERKINKIHNPYKMWKKREKDAVRKVL